MASRNAASQKRKGIRASEEAIRPVKRLRGKQPLLEPAELYPEVQEVSGFEDLDIEADSLELSVEAKRRKSTKLEVKLWPPVWVAVDFDCDSCCAWLNMPPRLRRAEACRDAQLRVRRERLHWRQVSAEVCGDDSDGDHDLDSVLLVGRVTTKGLQKLKGASKFAKFFSQLVQLQDEQIQRCRTAQLALQRSVVSEVRGTVMQFAFPAGYKAIM
mmetsp:Transcript_63453/g.112829  ORF Transcript_63453/g.112829 Transcript_63453/m.112829 type:complete len:214 (-) Transcript_63453:132-773(-)|eukprot:CAMPEP_0197659558 /NCGR_PEP_ID=MMETSP1338-20131121/48142_1 /TAXON_ID=43686 ORGANISM="Pelagodinium beii, Strain RCC1491" /NCGR_SAMPLE_ID=MMETSP1338 /ASSEMBLY_ACC=CAM_ASM_000754 /LENGTH=213 /DNA_ID=CAMNT_0043236543 /DNA_START=50 /DNA_END=691 /DNA_ORIENTATION=+